MKRSGDRGKYTAEEQARDSELCRCGAERALHEHGDGPSILRGSCKGFMCMVPMGKATAGLLTPRDGEALPSRPRGAHGVPLPGAAPRASRASRAA